MPQAPVSKSQIKTVLQKSERSAFTRYRGEDGFKKAEDGYAGDGNLPENVGFKKVSSREEKITVVGKEYNSTVITLRMEDRRGKKELILWEVKDLTLQTRIMGMPGPDFLLNAHVVKVKLSLSGSGHSLESIRKVVKIKEELTIGKHKILCLVEKLEGFVDRRGARVKPKGEYWTSEDVPGRAVKLLMSGTFSKDSKRWPGEQIIESITVIDFKAIRKGSPR